MTSQPNNLLNFGFLDLVYKIQPIKSQIGFNNNTKSQFGFNNNTKSQIGFNNKKKKKVSFNLNKNIIYPTYSKNDYDRSQIDSFIYRFSYKRLNLLDKMNMFKELNNFKRNEMKVHDFSKKNTKYHSTFFF